MNIAPLEPIGAVEFDRIPVTQESGSGFPIYRWVLSGMPKLGEYQYLLDHVFFLYPSESAANEGKKAGGSGFFVTIPFQSNPQYQHAYAVTNWHVAVQSGSSVVRVNGQDGKPRIFPFEPHEWYFIPKKHDIAVIPIALNQKDMKVEAINSSSFFLTEDEIKKFEIEAADDVFMLGRFVDYDGVVANVPAMRFGNISMMNAKVSQPTGYVGNSIAVDMHSRTGFSGSPVYVYRTNGSFFTQTNIILGGGHLMKLLGILWGQFPEEWNIQDASTKVQSEATATATLDGKSVTGWSGMSLVAPASAIWEVLNMPELQKSRMEFEKKLSSITSSAPVAQSAPPASDENPKHREDFTSLLKAASETPPQDD